jgi:hypothetical protein
MDYNIIICEYRFLVLICKQIKVGLPSKEMAVKSALKSMACLQSRPPCHFDLLLLNI